MIEIVYKEKQEHANGTEGYYHLPKNIRQVGDTNGRERIYLEDYVGTFLKKYFSAPEGRAAMLFGEFKWADGISYFFIRSAAAIHTMEPAPDHLVFDDAVWTEVHDVMEKYFKNQQILGWALSLPGYGEDLNEQIIRAHLNHFGGNDKTLFRVNGQEKEETFYTYEGGALRSTGGSQRSVTNMVILLASFGMLALTIYLYTKGGIGFEGVLTCTIAMMGSFGPVVALSSLSNNLNQTLASGERVLSLLEEAPLVEEIPGDAASGGDHAFAGAEAQNVTFAYKDETILDQYSLKLEPGKITGIHGASGSGKSTILKLLMRFWDVQTGRVSVDGADVRKIPTKHLRDMESYVTQETHLFHDSSANTIAIAKPGATREEIMEAAEKASIHDFIMTLPNGYDTEVGELGDTLSGGEKQRIGIARAFLHDASMILLDEPTSNLDSLNEGIILKSLKESAEEKTIVLVSHRVSTMNVADVVYEMENGRIS